MSRKARCGGSALGGHADKGEFGYMASDCYKARLTKGLLGVDLGEGYIIEVLNFRLKKVLRRELFESSEEAREELEYVRDDIKLMTTEEFREKYLQPSS
ncbi:MAG: hypothetical protein CVT63_05955 [Candidatus Anoxymicrobium japonicum]|uniref:Uncharacterized protein n=1 Tax=Candidatus Anoxymicrobium japonicum TaxID=2013648 RepID=A0A2N3G522_9ACTN|nr:MAG: hypothetical protein CVT63_05955 [Candidatus Anoxymicrobium japonicum]